MNYVILIGFVQALLVIGFRKLFKIKNAHNSDSVLSVLLLVILLHLGTNFVLNIGVPTAEIHKGFYTFLSLSYPVLLWMFSEKILHSERDRNNKFLFHFIPVFMAAILYFYVVFFILLHNGHIPGFINIYNNIVGYSFVVLGIVYPMLIIRNNKRIGVFWTQEKRMLNLSAILLFFYSTVSFFFQLRKMVGVDPILMENQVHLMRTIFYLTLVIITICILYLKIYSFYYLTTEVIHSSSISQENNTFLSNHVDKSEEAFEDNSEEVSGEDTKQLHPNIDYERILSGIRPLMDEQKIYMDSELTLDKLAKISGVSRHHLSATINQYIGKSFYQYINEYRIDMVKQMLDASKSKGLNPNILSFAYEAGFHSKSSFNLYFKKMVGCTPSQYYNSSFNFSTNNTQTSSITSLT